MTKRYIGAGYSAAGTRIYRVFGRKYRAHAACADGFKADRRGGLIYGAVLVRDAGEPQVWLTWEQASLFYGNCAYCNT